MVFNPSPEQWNRVHLTCRTVKDLGVPVMQMNQQSLQRAQERYLICVCRRRLQRVRQLRGPVRLYQVEVGIKMLEDIPRDDHIGKACRSVISRVAEQSRGRPLLSTMRKRSC